MLLRDQDVDEGRRELTILDPRHIFESALAFWSKPKAPPEDERGVYWHRLDDGRCGIIGCVLPWSISDEDMESLTLFEMYQQGVITEDVYNFFKQLNKVEYSYEPEQWHDQLIYLGHKSGYIRKENEHGKEEKQKQVEAPVHE